MKTFRYVTSILMVATSFAYAADIKTTANVSSSARVCVVNVVAMEQSCDGDSPSKLQVIKIAADNIDNRRKESFISSALSAYVGQGFRIVSCYESSSGKESGPICIVARDTK